MIGRNGRRAASPCGRAAAEEESALTNEAASPLWVRRAERKIGVAAAPAHPFGGSGAGWTPNVMRSGKGAAIEPSLGELTTSDQRAHVVRVMWARHVMFAGLFATAMLLPGFASQRFIVLAGLGFAWIPVGLVMHLTTVQTGRIPQFAPWVDAFANLFMVAVAPSLLPYGIVLAIGQAGIGIVAYGTVSACLSALALVVGFLGIELLSGKTHSADLAMLALFASFVPSMAYLSHLLRHVERLVKHKYADLLDGLDAVVWEADPVTLQMTFVSPKARAVFGVDHTKMRLDWFSFVHPDDRDGVYARKRATVDSSGEDSLIMNYRMIDREGQTVVVRDAVLIRRNAKGVAVQVRGVVADVTSEQQAQKTIQKQAQYDTLTRLPNRSLFNEELERSIEESTRTRVGTVVLLLDLNGFKEVNDTLGHAVGDLLLQGIAGRLAAYLPANSSIARLGGDEFAVSVSPATIEDGLAVADTIAAALTPGFTIDQMTIQAAASIGLARFPDHGESPSALLRRADAAMYEAKRTGRSHVVATADDDAANLRRLELLGELRTAIVSGDFRLYHQPKIDVATGRVVGTEGLVRWQHPRHGLLAPSHFVELSELSGLIQPLTRWVIEQGVRHLADWRKQGIDITVALNMSVRNFFDHDLVTFISGLLRDHGVPGDRLVLEITESEVMADRALARVALHSFRSLGVKIAIDDFGTGFSSLSQLQQLPIDEIKVDQSFVRDMLADQQDFTIVRSIIDLGHNLGLGVVVEGVEEERQLQALQAMGADRAQGYFIARPMPANDFPSWIAEYEPLRPLAPVEPGYAELLHSPVGAPTLGAGLRSSAESDSHGAESPRPADVAFSIRPETSFAAPHSFLVLSPAPGEAASATPEATSATPEATSAPSEATSAPMGRSSRRLHSVMVARTAASAPPPVTVAAPVFAAAATPLAPQPVPAGLPENWRQLLGVGAS